MHVLVITPVYFPWRLPHGGNFYHEHALAAVSRSVRIGIACPELRSLGTLFAGDAGRFRFQTEVSEIDGIRSYKRLGWAVPGYRRMSNRLWVHLARRLARRYAKEQGRPDLLHAHWGIRAGFAARSIAADLGIPYVVTEHFTGFARNVVQPWEAAQAQLAYRDADGLSAVSGALAKTIAPYTAGREVCIVPNCVRTDDFPLATRTGRACFSFLTVCHLHPKKGVDVLIRAFASRFRGDTDASLAIGGDGPERVGLEALARELDVSSQVRFLGQLDRTGVGDAMRAADCFVLASRFETFGVVVIEAMATGLPVVATASGGPEEIVTFETGTIVPVEDVRELAEAMLAVYRRRDAWRAAAPAIRSSVERRFSMEVVGTELRAFYERAVHAHRSFAGPAG